MKSNSRFVIFGSGGFGRELLNPLTLELRSRGDDMPIIFATDDPADGEIATGDIRPDDIVIISVADPKERRQIASRVSGNPGILRSPSSYQGPRVEIGEGSILCDFTTVTCDVVIGCHFHANIYSYVAHDCRIGDFVTFAPRVNCNGNVTIGDGTYIGTGACLRQGVTIGKNAVVGMGAVVVKDVDDGQTVVGNPAQPLER